MSSVIHPTTLLKLGLMGIATTASAIPSTVPADPHCLLGENLINPGFESGTLKGWQVVSGDAFGNKSITNVQSYWDGPFNQDGSYFMLGTSQAGESAVGELKSSSFKACSVLSFLVSGGYDSEHLYVGLVRDKDGKILLKQTGVNDEAFLRIVWDTSEWQGQSVHVVIHDSSTNEEWGHINFDGLRIGSHATNDGKGLTFNVLGQANQPQAGKMPTCRLFAKDPLRPQYHYTQYQGWINDPAGLIQWKGKHHLFSQYSPDAAVWGPIFWSHAVSTDAVHWRELPVALSPKETDDAEDESGMFTGSAFSDSSGLHLILTNYTDTSSHPDAVQESVIVASSTDGVNFEYYNNNPVIPGPPEGAPVFFRDPKAFHDPTDNSLKLAIGATNGVSGEVRLYRSSDTFSWSDAGIMYAGNGSTGDVWECPNFLPIGGKWALFYGGNGLGHYETGTFDGSKFKSEKQGLLDAGPASYAMQWYKDESDRNLAITWMANWPTPKWPSRANGWAGQQSITRELFLRKDGGLGSRPIKELDSLASGATKKFNRQTIEDKVFHVGNSNTARLKLTVDLSATTASSFTLALFQSKAESTLLTYNTRNATLTLDTRNAGYGQAGTWDAAIDTQTDGKLNLDIFLDRSVLEAFVGDGTVFSATVFPRYQESTSIGIIGTGGKVVVDSLSLTPLGSSWC
ncbi:sucrose-6-phosphate hydrolase [Xylaria arbuscula]|nr:sucrose-6-phosphate hydrolase [Xylaria arbuscula]